MDTADVRERGHEEKREAQHKAYEPPVVVAFVAAYVIVAAGRLVFRVDPEWYDRLVKPSWALPAPFQEGGWFVALGLLAYSSVAMFRKAGGTGTAHAVLAIRVLHFILLQALVVLLFQLKYLLPAAIDVTLLLSTAIAIALTAWRRSGRVAAVVSVYTVWLAYDVAVTWSLWALNR